MADPLVQTTFSKGGEDLLERTVEGGSDGGSEIVIHDRVRPLRLLASGLDVSDAVRASASTATADGGNRLTVEDVYDVAGIAAWIRRRGLNRIGLQIPDEFLSESRALVDAIKEALGGDGPVPSVFLMADTSYGSCCVDEVAAEHVGADGIVHIGRACLSRTSRLPVLYEFGARRIDIDALEAALNGWLAGADGDSDDPIVLAWSVFYDHAMGAFAERVQARAAEEDGEGSAGSSPRRWSRVVLATISREAEPDAGCENLPVASGCCGGVDGANDAGGGGCGKCGCDGANEAGGSGCGKCGCDGANEAASASSALAPSDLDQDPLMGRMLGRDLPSALLGGTDGSLSDGVSLFYVGPSDPTLAALVMNNPTTPIFAWNPAADAAGAGSAVTDESRAGGRLVRKRYAMVERVRTSSIIGIVVGTLGVARYRTVISRLKTIIAAAGRKSYTFVIGKLNVAKLANFSEIDVFVLVACPENTMVDSREFYTPIVSPFDVELALVPDRTWTGAYTTDFNRILATDLPPEMEAEGTGGLRTHTSVDGVVREWGVDHETDAAVGGSRDVVVRNTETRLAERPSAATVFEGRSFKGLEQRIGETPVATLAAGRRGIARGYEAEGGARNQRGNESGSSSSSSRSSSPSSTSSSSASV